MNYIDKESTSTTLTFNTREESGSTLSFTMYEDGNRGTSINLGDYTLADHSYYQSVTINPSNFILKDEITYELEASNTGGDLVYKGRAFVTSQSISAYKINDTDYTQDNSGNNDYILY